jgi:NACHT domain
VRAVPEAWLAQTRPGGKILTTLSGWLYGYARVLLTVHADGTAEGPLLPGTISFMAARTQNRPEPGNPSHWAALTRSATPRPARHSPGRLEELTAEGFFGLFLAQLAAPNAQLASEGDTTHLIDVTTGSVATLTPSGPDGNGTVRQAGPLRLWDAIEAAWDAWDQADRPGPESFRMRISRGQQTIATWTCRAFRSPSRDRSPYAGSIPKCRSINLQPPSTSPNVALPIAGRASIVPDLPFAAIAAAVAGMLLWALKQFLGEGIKHVGSRFWPKAAAGRGVIRRAELRRYQRQVAATFSRQALGFLRGSEVALPAVYVPLQHERDGRREDIYEEIRSTPRTVALGAAGAGKSMLLKNSMVRWAERPDAFPRIPVLVELVRYNTVESIDELLREAFQLRGVKNPERFIPKALSTGRLSVFFDGLDEVITARRDAAIAQIRYFAELNPACQVVVTCRDAVYEGELSPIFGKEVRLAGFDDAAIRRFLRLWFRREDPDRDVREEVEQLMAALRAAPAMMRLAQSPLLLTMIASLHDADPGTGSVLSSSRAEFYEMAVDHLLRRDRDLGRHGELATYKAGHKKMALRGIALAAQGAMAPDSDRRTMSEEELLTYIAKVLPRFNLDATPHAGPMLDEIVTRSGLLVKVDAGNLLYEFPHLTLQEYLAAVELADVPDRLLELYKENPSRWRETLKLWCAGAHRDCTEVIRSVFAGTDQDRLLALECLAEARQVDDELATEIVEYFVDRLGNESPTHHLVVAALGAVASDPGPRGRRLLIQLQQSAKLGVGTPREHASLALAATRLRPAIETLSELSGTLRLARAALRTTGELAIPVLADRAAAGALDAIEGRRHRPVLPRRHHHHHPTRRSRAAPSPRPGDPPPRQRLTNHHRPPGPVGFQSSGSGWPAGGRHGRKPPHDARSGVASRVSG